ncbi:MAG: tol-pal system protein YbgF [Syntrophotaleaceae bacterium]
MKLLMTVLSSLVLLGTLSGCIATQRQLSVERDLEEMKRRLAAAERSLAAQENNRTGETRDRLENLTQRQAELQAGLDALRLENQTLNGRLEDLSRSGAELREEMALVRDDLGLKITALEDQLKGSASVRTPQQAARQNVETPEDIYRRGVDLIQKQGRYEEGRKALQQFLSANPKHSLAVNASYWIGEAYYGEKQYENAILQFQDVIQKYGDHPKVASALLKQGLTFQTLGDKQSAKAILQKLVSSFPMSEEAKTAQQRLKSL